MPIRKQMVVLYVLLFLAASWFFNNYIQLKDYNQKRLVMQTITEIHVLSRNKIQADRAMEKTYQRIKEIEKRLNYFDPSSETTKLNARANWQEVKVSEDMLNILKAAIVGAEKSNGTFDITATPITKLYGFGQESKKTQRISAIQNIIVDDKNKTVRFMKRKTMIDLGGIIRGYAADEAVKILKANGLKQGLVNVGGDIFAFGTNRGKPWKIGVQDPKDPKHSTLTTVELVDQACATSGDYEQFFYDDKKKIANIFNPHSGLPANLNNNLRGVTVIADSGSEADIIAAACLVLGKEQAEKYFNNKLIFY